MLYHVPSGNSSNKKNDVVQLNETNHADVTITDTVGDVWSIDYMTQEASVVTSHPDIEVDNLDIVEATYTQQGVQVTLSLQVVGSIENRGKIIDLYDEDPFE